ncbi:MAG: hypothetical protein LRS49_06540, partial [Desulfurococcales archaeon]|nr:hypothetical protein [Desulfurococcales archaeon]
MDQALAAGLALLAVGAAGLAALYRRPTARPLVRSGYTAAAVVVAFLAMAGMAGALAMPARSFSEIASAAMVGVVEGFYSDARLVNTTANATAAQAREALAATALEALEAASRASLPAGSCRLEGAPYALVSIQPIARARGVAYPGTPAYILVDPRLPEGRAYLASAPPANYTAALRGAGLEVAGGLNASGDPVLARLQRECGGLRCFWNAQRVLGGFRAGVEPGMEYRVVVPGPGGYERIVMAENDMVLAPQRAEYIAVAVAPGSLRDALRSVWLYANATNMTVNLTRAPALVYSLIVADLPDSCYSRLAPQAIVVFVERVYREAAPPGYTPYIFTVVSNRAGMVSNVRDMATAGSILSLAILASILVAAASPLAASGAVSLARSVALLRLRGYTMRGVRRQLRLATLAALLAGGAAGLAALGLLAPGFTAYTGRLGVAAAAGVTALALLLMLRRASREAASVYVEAVARGNPLASTPPSPPSGLGRAGWLGLALGVYHAVRGYAGFSTAEYLDRHWEQLSTLNPALQALLAIWAFIEIFTAPFAPALLAYASARLLAWKAPAIASSGALRRLLGRAAPASRGLARLVSARAVALVVLAVFAVSLLAASGLASSTASAWIRSGAATVTGPGALAVKPLEPSGNVTVNYTTARLLPNGTVAKEVANATFTTYRLRDALSEAERACPGGLVAAGVPSALWSIAGEQPLPRGYRSAVIAGLLKAASTPGSMRLVVAYSDLDKLAELYQRIGVELSGDQLDALAKPGWSLRFPDSRGSMGSSSNAGFILLDGSSGEIDAIPASNWIGVEVLPGADVGAWYSNLTGRRGAGVPYNAYALGPWAYRRLPSVVGYPAGSGVRPVVLVYTLGQGGCVGRLEELGFHVYTPSDVARSREFRVAASVLSKAHPASFLVPAALASSALALAAALVLAADADRELRPFLALLRLRGASRGEGLRIGLALWGVFIGASLLIGVAVGLGVAEGAMNLVTGMAGSSFRYTATVTLPGGAAARVFFLGGAAKSLAVAWRAVAYPLLLGAALMAP